MAITHQCMTAEELERMPSDEYRYDLIRGELIRMAPAGAKHGSLGARFLGRVERHATEHDLGAVFTAETGFILARDPDVVLAPDVAFVRKERLPAGELPDGFLELAPDLVVEIVSPSDRVTDVVAKIMEYLDAGVRLVWLVEPKRQIVTVYGPDRQARILGCDDVLDGGSVLPGFRLAVADLFR